MSSEPKEVLTGQNDPYAGIDKATEGMEAMTQAQMEAPDPKPIPLPTPSLDDFNHLRLLVRRLEKLSPAGHRWLAEYLNSKA